MHFFFLSLYFDVIYYYYIDGSNSNNEIDYYDRENYRKKIALRTLPRSSNSRK